MNDLKKFKSEIEQLAAFANRIGFDVVKGDIKELARLWVVDSQKIYNAQNAAEVSRIVKSLI